MKKNVATGLAMVVVAMAMVLGGLVVDAGAAVINSFEDLMSGATRHAVGSTDNPYDPMLLTDSFTGETYPIPDDQEWHMGFVMDIGGGDSIIVGYAKNLLGSYSGLMDGRYNQDLPDGEKPDEIWLIWDQNEDGLGQLVGGEWYLGGDDVLFTSQDILFGESLIRGDISQLPAIEHARTVYDYVWLPHMVLSPIPEPATMGLLSLGGLLILRRRRCN